MSEDPSKVRPWRLTGLADEYDRILPDGHVISVPPMTQERQMRGVDGDKTVDQVSEANLDLVPVSPEALGRNLLASGAVDRDGYPVEVQHRVGHPELGEQICIDCAYYKPDRCEMFAQPTMPDDTCNRWTDHR